MLDPIRHFLSLIWQPTEQLLPVLADNQSLLMALVHLGQSHAFTSLKDERDIKARACSDCYFDVITIEV